MATGFDSVEAGFVDVSATDVVVNPGSPVVMYVSDAGFNHAAFSQGGIAALSGTGKWATTPANSQGLSINVTTKVLQLVFNSDTNTAFRSGLILFAATTTATDGTDSHSTYEFDFSVGATFNFPAITPAVNADWSVTTSDNNLVVTRLQTTVTTVPYVTFILNGEVSALQNGILDAVAQNVPNGLQSIAIQAASATNSVTPPNNCLAGETQVVLADGSKGRIQELRGTVHVQAVTPASTFITVPARVVACTSLVGVAKQYGFEYRPGHFVWASESHGLLTQSEEVVVTHCDCVKAEPCERCRFVQIDTWRAFQMRDVEGCATRSKPAFMSPWYHLVLLPEHRNCAVILEDGSVLSESFRSDDSVILANGFTFVT